jgi:hypothetical protein
MWYITQPIWFKAVFDGAVQVIFIETLNNSALKSVSNSEYHTYILRVIEKLE